MGGGRPAGNKERGAASHALPRSTRVYDPTDRRRRRRKVVILMAVPRSLPQIGICQLHVSLGNIAAAAAVSFCTLPLSSRPEGQSVRWSCNFGRLGKFHVASESQLNQLLGWHNQPHIAVQLGTSSFLKKFLLGLASSS